MTEELPLEFAFTTTAAPVQAEGTVAGHRFYFHARHDEWTFAVAEQVGVEPVTLDSPAAARGCGWFCSGYLGAAWEHRASYLGLPEAEALIRRCAAQYLAERGG